MSVPVPAPSRQARAHREIVSFANFAVDTTRGLSDRRTAAMTDNAVHLTSGQLLTSPASATIANNSR
ncbi:hypothetical protein EMIT0P294_20688 [Pseudomonas sp. IT-P294]